MSLWASDKDILVIKSSSREYVLKKSEGSWVSESCLKSSCLALKKTEIKQQDSKDGFVGHPAASFCEQTQGEYVVGKRASGDEDGLCVFKDKSFILGWDYFYRNKKEKDAP